MATKRTRIIAVAMASTIGAGVAAAGIAVAADDDTERSITGVALERASAAALAHTGGGRVTDTEVGDEDAYYEVEVTQADGSAIDVHLNRDFSVVGAKGDAADDED